MEKEQVLKILGALAAGVDPVAGDAVPGDHVLQQPDVIRALHEAFAAVQHRRTPRTSSTAVGNQQLDEAVTAEPQRGSQIPIPMPAQPRLPRPRASRNDAASPAPTAANDACPPLEAKFYAFIRRARASLLGPSDPAVKARERAAKSKRWTREDALQARKMFLAKSTVTAIAEQLGHDRASVLSLFKYMDLISDEEEAKGVESYPRSRAPNRMSA